MLMILRRIKLFGLVILLLCVDIVKAQHITLLQQGKPTSIRGLSVVDNNIAWISGSKGYIALTKDGGKIWAWQQVKGYEHSDFRGIYALSAKEAIVMSSGTPAVILKTINGGITWAKKYNNTGTSYFLDALDFADAKHGYILGDPINRKFLLLETIDGGETWNSFKNQPNAIQGEACFAASGTCLRVYGHSIYIVTGGTNSRMLTYNDKDNKWDEWPLPITHGKPSQGTFSLAIGRSQGIFVGGDYSNVDKADSVAAIQSKNYYPTIKPIIHGPAGYQSCIEFMAGNTYLSTGTSGTNITTDGGQTWTKIDTNSFNVCRKAKRGTLILLAGDKGEIALFKL